MSAWSRASPAEIPASGWALPPSACRRRLSGTFARSCGFPAGCPYRGLDPFTEEHVDYYYGREHATSQLLASLAARDFVPVVAVSGGGKSSLLQAGMAKGLRDRPVAGLAQRIRCYQRVGSQPHAELLHSLAAARDTPPQGADRSPGLRSWPRRFAAPFLPPS